jgi:CBS domain-containing protein
MDQPVSRVLADKQRGGEIESISPGGRCRHLPVVDDDQVVGMISIGDLTRWLVADQQNKIQDLEGYIMRS